MVLKKLAWKDDKLLRFYCLAYVMLIVRTEEKLQAEGKGVMLVQELLHTALTVDEELYRMEAIRPWLVKEFYTLAQNALPLVRKSLYCIDLLKEADYLNDDEYALLHGEGSALVDRFLRFIRTVERKARFAEQKRKRAEELEEIRKTEKGQEAELHHGEPDAVEEVKHIIVLVKPPRPKAKFRIKTRGVLN